MRKVAIKIPMKDFKEIFPVTDEGVEVTYKDQKFYAYPVDKNTVQQQPVQTQEVQTQQAFDVNGRLFYTDHVDQKTPGVCQQCNQIKFQTFHSVLFDGSSRLWTKFMCIECFRSIDLEMKKRGLNLAMLNKSVV